EVVAGALPRQPAAAAVVEHGDGDGVRAMFEQLGFGSVDDALHVALEPGVERGLNARTGAANVLDEVRREERVLALVETQPLVEIGARCVHPLQDRAVAYRLRRRPTRQRREVCRLRDGELLGVAAEIAPAGAGHADGLLAVRREVEVENEDLFLAVARLELQRDDGLAELLPARAPLEQQLRDLLRDR